MPTIVALGDSITANGEQITATKAVTRNHGYTTWLAAGLGRAYTVPVTLHAAGGDTTTEMLARLPAILTAAPDVCVVHGGTNDLTSGATLASATANLRDIYEGLAAAGIQVVAVPILPRDGLTATQETLRQDINRWIRARSGTYLVNTLVDLEQLFAGDGGPRPGLLTDGLHPTIAGAALMGQTIADALTPGGPGRTTPAALAGSLLVNGALVGVGGTITRNGSGGIADGWTLDPDAQASQLWVDASKQAAARETSERQILRVTGHSPISATDAVVLFQQSVAPGLLTAGETVRATCDIAMAQAHQVTAAYLSIRAAGTQTFYADCGGKSSDTDTLPDHAWRGRLRTPDMVLPAGLTDVTVRLVIQFAPDSDVETTVAIGGITLDQVA